MTLLWGAYPFLIQGGISKHIYMCIYIYIYIYIFIYFLDWALVEERGQESLGPRVGLASYMLVGSAAVGSGRLAGLAAEIVKNMKMCQ